MDNDKMTPGRYAYERVEKISPHLSGWGYADKPAWEQFAIDIHEAVERQRRDLAQNVEQVPDGIYYSREKTTSTAPYRVREWVRNFTIHGGIVEKSFRTVNQRSEANKFRWCWHNWSSWVVYNIFAQRRICKKCGLIQQRTISE